MARSHTSNPGEGEEKVWGCLGAGTFSSNHHYRRPPAKSRIGFIRLFATWRIRWMDAPFLCHPTYPNRQVPKSRR